MKKLFVGIVIFTVVSIGVTWFLIKNKNEKMNLENIEISSDISGDKNQDFVDNAIETSREKTLDLYGLYNQNDIVVEDVEERIELSNLNATINIPKIKGLKDKKIEEKINKDIKKRIYEKVNEVSKKDNVSIERTYTATTYNCSNFSNVISYEWNITYNVSGEQRNNYEYVYLNYELVNGERLKFEDIFIKDADLYSIIRRMFYRQVAKNSLGNEAESGAYYDKKSGKWLYDGFDFDTGEDVTREYFPAFTEYDIAKKIDEFMESEENDFYFTPSKIYIVSDNNNYSYCLYFKDIADSVVIYDKYLIKESIYEASNIGLKNLWTCSNPNNILNDYIEYGFAEENLYYEVNLSRYTNVEEIGYPFIKSLDKIKSQLLETSIKKVEEYKRIAKENPNEFYVLSINPYYAIEDRNWNNQIFTQIDTYITSTDIKYKKEVMDELLASYRYHNLAFYRSALEHAGYTYDRREDKYYDGNIVFNSFEKKLEEKIYDARNLKVYDFDMYMYIIPDSNKTKIEKANIQNLSLEDLNRAYNEIFARHGHDFKNKELKEYFELCNWYTPIDNKSVSLEELNEIERYNLDIIKSVIAEKKI